MQLGCFHAVVDSCLARQSGSRKSKNYVGFANHLYQVSVVSISMMHM